MPFGNISFALARAFLLTQLTVCPPPAHAPQVEVIFFDEKPEYITEAPIASIDKVMTGQTYYSSLVGDSGKYIGMTAINLEAATRVQFDGVKDGAGNTCLHVAHVDFVIHYRPTVFIGKELGGHTCLFRMTKLHEERHVALDKKTVTEYIPQMKMDMLWYLRSLGISGPFPSAEVPKQQRAILTDIQKSAKPMMEKIYKVRDERGKQLDTPENYRQESSLCPGETLDLGSDKPAPVGGAKPAPAGDEPVN